MRTSRWSWAVVAGAMVVALSVAMAGLTGSVTAGLVFGGAILVGIPIALAIVLIVFLLPIAVHEAGHVLGGWLAGYRFQGMIVGPFRLERAGSSLRLGWGGLTHLDGRAYLIRQNSTRGREALMISGGAVVGLAWSGLLIWLVLRWPGVLDALWFMAIYSIVINLVAVIPMRFRRTSSDGLLLLRLARGELTAITPVPIMQTTEMWTRGVRAREWPLDDLAKVDARTLDAAAAATLGLLRYYARVDRGDFEGAAQEIRAANEAMEDYIGLETKQVTSFVKVLAAEEAFMNGLLKRPIVGAGRALAALGQVEPGELNLLPPRLAAVIALRKGRPELVRAATEYARAAVQQHGNPPLAGFDLDLLDQIAAEAEIKPD